MAIPLKKGAIRSCPMTPYQSFRPPLSFVSHYSLYTFHRLQSQPLIFPIVPAPISPSQFHLLSLSSLISPVRCLCHSENKTVISSMSQKPRSNPWGAPRVAKVYFYTSHYSGLCHEAQLSPLHLRVWVIATGQSITTEARP